MKTQSTTVMARLTSEEINNLTAHPVKETLATNNCNKKSFTTIDLWSIQKQKRNYGIRSFA